MALPERYRKKVPDMTQLWGPRGTFEAQTKVWVAQSEARHQLHGAPSSEELAGIRKAVVLSDADIEYMTEDDQAHETNRLIRLIQGRIEPRSAGNYVHLGNTSNDVLDTGLSIQMLQGLDILITDFTRLEDTLLKLALQHQRTPQVGRSHGQHAIPHTFGRQVLGWYAETARGTKRLQDSKPVIAVGKLSGEVGTNVINDRELEDLSLKKLGLTADEAPTQVISRDRHAQVLANLAVNGGSLARFSTDVRLLALTGVDEVQEYQDPKKQGSSSMPHKRNPDISERITGLSHIVQSAAGIELKVMPLWLERDISHSGPERFVFDDAFGTLAYMTRLTNQVMSELVVHTDKMAANLDATYGGIYSARLLDAMMRGGLSRTVAYDLVKPLAQTAIDTRTPLSTLVAATPEIMDFIDGKELDELFKPDFYLRNVDVAFDRVQEKH